MVPSSGSGAGGVDACASVVLVCAPPLLLMVTPDATWVLDDVVPDVDVPAVVDPAPVDPAAVVESESSSAVEEGPAPVVDASVDPPDGSPGDVAELAEDDSEDVSVVSALATAGEVATITPMPKAAARAPTRPTCLPSAVLCSVRRPVAEPVGGFVADANSGLTGRWFLVMRRLRCGWGRTV
ncbi:hypothetical protein ACFQWH_06860 [Mycolicibacterium sp. GCM10028919]|uniref:hypothetical protein n=1 Tax=Mycolicibacterium sp. GCM10028919 TaxID=3273401 RepID=UPI00361A7449